MTARVQLVDVVEIVADVSSVAASSSRYAPHWISAGPRSRFAALCTSPLNQVTLVLDVSLLEVSVSDCDSHG